MNKHDRARTLFQSIEHRIDIILPRLNSTSSCMKPACHVYCGSPRAFSCICAEQCLAAVLTLWNSQRRGDYADASVKIPIRHIHSAQKIFFRSAAAAGGSTPSDRESRFVSRGLGLAAKGSRRSRPRFRARRPHRAVALLAGTALALSGMQPAHRLSPRSRRLRSDLRRGLRGRRLPPPRHRVRLLQPNPSSADRPEVGDRFPRPRSAVPRARRQH